MKWHCFILMLFPGLVLFGQPKRDPPEKIVFTHVAVSDEPGGRANPDATVVVGDGRILDVTDSRLPVPKDGRIINGAGKYLIPGLWDMHGHGFENAFPLLIANGITGFRFMGSARGPNVERIASLRKQIAAGTMLGPRIVAVCPVISGYKSNKQGESIVVTTAEEARQGVDAIQPHDDFLNVMARSPRNAV